LKLYTKINNNNKLIFKYRQNTKKEVHLKRKILILYIIKYIIYERNEKMPTDREEIVKRAYETAETNEKELSPTIEELRTLFPYLMEQTLEELMTALKAKSSFYKIVPDELKKQLKEYSDVCKLEEMNEKIEELMGSSSITGDAFETFKNEFKSTKRATTDEEYECRKKLAESLFELIKGLIPLAKYLRVEAMSDAELEAYKRLKLDKPYQERKQTQDLIDSFRDKIKKAETQVGESENAYLESQTTEADERIIRAASSLTKDEIDMEFLIILYRSRLDDIQAEIDEIEAKSPLDIKAELISNIHGHKELAYTLNTLTDKNITKKIASLANDSIKLPELVRLLRDYQRLLSDLSAIEPLAYKMNKDLRTIVADGAVIAKDGTKLKLPKVLMKELKKYMQTVDEKDKPSQIFDNILQIINDYEAKMESLVTGLSDKERSEIDNPNSFEVIGMEPNIALFAKFKDLIESACKCTIESLAEDVSERDSLERKLSTKIFGFGNKNIETLDGIIVKKQSAFYHVISSTLEEYESSLQPINILREWINSQKEKLSLNKNAEVENDETQLVEIFRYLGIDSDLYEKFREFVLQKTDHDTVREDEYSAINLIAVAIRDEIIRNVDEGAKEQATLFDNILKIASERRTTRKGIIKGTSQSQSRR